MYEDMTLYRNVALGIQKREGFELSTTTGAATRP